MTRQPLHIWHFKSDRNGFRLYRLYPYLCLWLLTSTGVYSAPANNSSYQNNTSEIYNDLDIPSTSSIPIVDISLTSNHTITSTTNNVRTADVIQTTNDPQSTSDKIFSSVDSMSLRNMILMDSTSVSTITASTTATADSPYSFSDISVDCETCPEDSVTAISPSSTVQGSSASVTPGDAGLKDPNGPPYSKCSDVVNSWYAAQGAKRDHKDIKQTTSASEMLDKSSVSLETSPLKEVVTRSSKSDLESVTNTPSYGKASPVTGEFTFSDLSETFEFSGTESISTSSNWTMKLTSISELNTSSLEYILASSFTPFLFDSSDDISSTSSPSLSDFRINSLTITTTPTEIKGNNVGATSTDGYLDSLGSKPIYTVYYNFSGVIVFCETTELPTFQAPKTTDVLDPATQSVNVTQSATPISSSIDDANGLATDSIVIIPTATSGPDVSGASGTTSSASSNGGGNTGKGGNTTPGSGSGGGSGDTVGGTTDSGGSGSADVTSDGDDGGGGVDGTNRAGDGVNGDGGNGTNSSENNEESTGTSFSETIETTTPYSRRVQAVSQPVLVGLICGLVFCVAMIILCTCLWKFCCKGPNMTPQLYKYKAKILKVSPVPPTQAPPSRQKLVFIAD